MAWKAAEHGDLEFRTCDPSKPEDFLQKRKLIEQKARYGDMRQVKDVFMFTESQY